MKSTTTTIVGRLAVAAAMMALAACSTLPRPGALDDADRMLAQVERADLEATQPALILSARTHRDASVAALDRGQSVEAELHAEIARQKLRTAAQLQRGNQARTVLAVVAKAGTPRPIAPVAPLVERPAEPTSKPEEEPKQPAETPPDAPAALHMPSLNLVGGGFGGEAASAEAIFGAEDARLLALVLRPDDKRLVQGDHLLETARSARTTGAHARASQKAQEATMVYTMIRLSDAPGTQAAAASAKDKAPVQRGSAKLRRAVATHDAALAQLEAYGHQKLCPAQHATMKSFLERARAAADSGDDAGGQVYAAALADALKACQELLRAKIVALEADAAALEKTLLAQTGTPETPARVITAQSELMRAREYLVREEIDAAEASLATVRALSVPPPPKPEPVIEPAPALNEPSTLVLPAEQSDAAVTDPASDPLQMEAPPDAETPDKTQVEDPSEAETPEVAQVEALPEPETPKVIKVEAPPEPETPKVAKVEAPPEPETPKVAKVEAPPEPETPKVVKVEAPPEPETPKVVKVEAPPEPETPKVAKVEAPPEPETPKVAKVEVPPEPETPKVAKVEAPPEPETPKVAKVDAPPEPAAVEVVKVEAPPEPETPKVAKVEGPTKPAAVEVVKVVEVPKVARVEVPEVPKVARVEVPKAAPVEQPKAPAAPEVPKVAKVEVPKTPEVAKVATAASQPSAPTPATGGERAITVNVNNNGAKAPALIPVPIPVGGTRGPAPVIAVPPATPAEATPKKATYGPGSTVEVVMIPPPTKVTTATVEPVAPAAAPPVVAPVLVPRVRVVMPEAPRESTATVETVSIGTPASRVDEATSAPTVVEVAPSTPESGAAEDPGTTQRVGVPEPIAMDALPSAAQLAPHSESTAMQAYLRQFTQAKARDGVVRKRALRYLKVRDQRLARRVKAAEKLAQAEAVLTKAQVETAPSKATALADKTQAEAHTAQHREVLSAYNQAYKDWRAAKKASSGVDAAKRNLEVRREALKRSKERGRILSARAARSKREAYVAGRAEVRAAKAVKRAKTVDGRAQLRVDQANRKLVAEVEKLDALRHAQERALKAIQMAVGSP